MGISVYLWAVLLQALVSVAPSHQAQDGLPCLPVTHLPVSALYQALESHRGSPVHTWAAASLSLGGQQ